jgi:hypothetical protein
VKYRSSSIQVNSQRGTAFGETVKKPKGGLMPGVKQFPAICNGLL